MNKPTGRFLLLEGRDKSGKTTQCELLVDRLVQEGYNQGKVLYIHFPIRTTAIGQMLDQYLKGEIELAPQVSHLLFSANRWEHAKQIQQWLDEGYLLVMDRYCYSGEVFSVAALNLDRHWCHTTDVGLPMPDQVFYLDLTEEELAKRNVYAKHEERYEVQELQERAHQEFLRLAQSDTSSCSQWKLLDASGTPEQVHQLLYQEFKQL